MLATMMRFGVQVDVAYDHVDVNFLNQTAAKLAANVDAAAHDALD
jgi:hypothetical protein